MCVAVTRCSVTTCCYCVWEWIRPGVDPENDGIMKFVCLYGAGVHGERVLL